MATVGLGVGDVDRDVDQRPVVPAVTFRAGAFADAVPGPRRQPSGEASGGMFACEGGHLMIASHRQHVADRSFLQHAAQLRVGAVDLDTSHPRRRDTRASARVIISVASAGLVANLTSWGTPGELLNTRIKKTAPKELRVSFAVDAEDILRRIEFVLDDGAELATHLRLTLRDFGKSLPIAAPPAATVGSVGR